MRKEWFLQKVLSKSYFRMTNLFFNIVLEIFHFRHFVDIIIQINSLLCIFFQ